jgi:hypothetical protein
VPVPPGIRQVVLAVLVQQDRDDVRVSPDGVHLKSVDGFVRWESISVMAPPASKPMHGPAATVVSRSRTRDTGGRGGNRRSAGTRDL